MNELPRCPQCESEYTYEDGDLYICPECGHEWAKTGSVEAEESARVIKDAYGSILNDGDSVTVIKDQKSKARHRWSRWVQKLKISAWWWGITILIARSMESAQ
jgi:alkylphosphonate utilization operon protein PhnA